MAEVKSFSIDVPDAVLDRIGERVAAYRWFPAPANETGWEYGMSTPVLKTLQSHWLEAYDWREAEKALNRHPQFTVEIDGIDIHFVHVIGEAQGRRPLLLTHGWPGSVYEFWDAIGPLAFPSQHGGRAEDAFDLVIPSLPGYGFSGKPASPLGQRATAALWDKLMRDVLGLDSYIAQGGDWGALVTSWLGVNHSAHDGKGGCRAIHLNMIGLRPTPATPQNETEAQWLQATQSRMAAEGSYFQQQASKPQTLALALMDSPMGQAAWIIEKFHGWSDLGESGDLFETYTRDQLLTNLMIYLVNDAFATSVWYYNALFQEGGNSLSEGQRCETPTGFANYPKEALYDPPPRSWCERVYNLVHWSDMPRGGHFAAMEAPDLFVGDLRAFAGKL